MTDKIDPASDALDPQCAKCGHKRSEHHYRHPFVGPSQQDTIADLQKKLAELEAANDAAEKSYRISDNGNLWRFWSDKARETSSKFDALKKRAEAAEARFIEQRDSLVSVTKKLAKTEAKMAGEYRRTDLPATDEQAFANEKVKALVEALQYYNTFGYEGKEARAALAAMETKP